ncbi:MAG: hypothetical protein P8170_10930 [Gemmatimonadota bacterium]
MNGKRVLLGGLLAGVFLNVSEGILNGALLMDDYQVLTQDYGLTEASWAMAGYILGAFVFGFFLAWLYAAIRPRFGPGWKTGAIAGTALWVVGYLVPGIWFGAMGLALGTGLTLLALVWGLAEMILAGIIAGWLYQEDAAAAPSAGAPAM